MLHVNQLIGFGAGRSGGPITISQTASPTSVDTSSSVATYTSVSIGVASADRIIVVAVTAETVSTTINSCTINSGGGAVAMNAGTAASSSSARSRLFYLAVPTGTTATIAVTFSGDVTAANHKISIYRLVGEPAFQSQSTKTAFNFSLGVSTGSITIPEGGCFIAVVCGVTDTSAVTWTEATEDLDIDAGGHRHTTAFRTTSGTVTISAANSSGNGAAMVWMIFSP